MMVEEKILTFINEMGYLNNEHVLGILFYGSFLTGFNTDKSDIDLHIIFDDSDPTHLIRGNKIIDETRIEYFEKPLGDILLTIEEDYENQNNASVSIFGKSKIIYEKDKQLKNLQNYVLNKFKDEDIKIYGIGDSIVDTKMLSLADIKFAIEPKGGLENYVNYVISDIKEIINYLD